MKRFALIASMVLSLAAGVPAGAGHAEGSVILPVVHPTIARELHNNGISSNLVGVVFSIPASAKGKTYTLTRTSGFGNLDVYFYADAGGGKVGGICSPIPQIDDFDPNQSSESATICPGSVTPGWAIVVLRTGLNAGFTFHYV